LWSAWRTGNPVYLGDVARIVDSPPQHARYTWLCTGPAAKRKGIETGGEFLVVTIAVTKKPGENAVVVADRLLARVAELENTVIPAGIAVTVTRNYGETANDKAMKLIAKLVFATLSVVALVLVALGRREAVIVGAAVILTLSATLFASWAWGFTLNRVSLFALIFSIGILVDDAIVVVENIHRHRALEPGAPLVSLIPKAVDEVGGPTIVATLTVIAACCRWRSSRAHGTVHEPDPDPRRRGHADLARDRFHGHAVARAAAARSSPAAAVHGPRGSMRGSARCSSGCSHRFSIRRGVGAIAGFSLAVSYSRSRCRSASRSGNGSSSRCCPSTTSPSSRSSSTCPPAPRSRIPPRFCTRWAPTSPPCPK
jgi:hypothetical protein